MLNLFARFFRVFPRFFFLPGLHVFFGDFLDFPLFFLDFSFFIIFLFFLRFFPPLPLSNECQNQVPLRFLPRFLLARSAMGHF